MAEPNLLVVDTEVNRHKEEIREIKQNLTELSKSHQETMLMVRTLVDSYKEIYLEIGSKMDKLSASIENLKPGKQDWEFEKRLENVENIQRALLRYKTPTIIALIILGLGVVAPEAIPPLLDAIASRSPVKAP